MLGAIYNLDIPQNMLTPIARNGEPRVRRLRLEILFLLLFTAMKLQAADWSGAEQQLARKIAAVTGPDTIAISFENLSSMGRRDSDVVQNGLRSALEQAGIHFVSPEQAAASLQITLSENAESYVWVAEIHQSAAESAVVMVSVPRTGRAPITHDATPLSLHKTLLWTQTDRILDVAVLEENGSPTRIAVLSPENISFYRSMGGKWQVEQVLAVPHANPWPLDLRGKLAVNRDRMVDAYLPGVVCHSTGSGAGLTMNCRDGDDPWPLVAAGIMNVIPGGSGSNSVPISPVAAFFAPTRNFFTGVLTPAIGKFSTVPKFYSAALVPREKYALWLLATTDGKVHIVDGMNDQAAVLDWGSDIASVRTACGAGWQVLAANAKQQETDAVRAYELPDRDPVAVSSAVELPGEISAMWTESKGDSAIVVVSNRETGSYEAYSVAVACNQ